MKYAVLLEKSAARFLLRLRDAKLKSRLDEAIESLAGDPRPPSCRKLAGTCDRYRVRVGDNRSEAQIGRYRDQLIQDRLPYR